MSGTPCISVLMAVYNTPPHYLDLAVTSVLSQTLSDFEFIIIDDGSNSATQAQLKELAARDSRIVLHILSENVGLTRALNIGLEFARGAYIARQDADDVSMPERFAKTVMFMEENPDIAAVGTYAESISSTGDPLGVIEPDIRRLEKRNVLIHGSMMFRRKCLECIGGYNETMRLSQDYEVYLRMVRLHGMRLGVMPEALYALRQHSGSLSSRRTFRQFYFSVMAKTLTLPSREGWRPGLTFMTIFTVDFFITHHLLLAPIVRRVKSALSQDKVEHRK